MGLSDDESEEWPMNKETVLQNRIREALSSRGCTVFRRNHGLYFTRDGRSVLVGVDGESDLQGHRPDGLCFYLEVKIPGEVPRANQEKFINAMSNSGAIAGWADSIEEALNVVMGVGKTYE